MWSQMPIEDGLTGSSDSTGSGQESHTSQVVAYTATPSYASSTHSPSCKLVAGSLEP